MTERSMSEYKNIRKRYNKQYNNIPIRMSTRRNRCQQRLVKHYILVAMPRDLLCKCKRLKDLSVANYCNDQVSNEIRSKKKKKLCTRIGKTIGKFMYYFLTTLSVANTILLL
jgi:tRNA A-37 threonylcarbamoyl transferase component Bud32